jgi:drug/metabolite transporter (DMT)-like permease
MVSLSLARHSDRNPQERSQTNESRIKILTIAAIFATVIFWASAFGAIRVALQTYSPQEVALIRYLVASVLLVIYAVLKRMPLPRGQDLPLIFACGFIGFTLYNLALNAGEMTVSAGTASFIISSEVGIIALLARLFLGERLAKIGWVGVVICIVGVGVISLGAQGGLQLSIGALLVFFATIAISVYSVIQKPLLQRYSAIQFTTYAIWAGTLCLLLIEPQAVFSIARASLDSTIAVVYMGIFPGVVAYIAWSYVLSKIPASQAGSYLATIPVVALFIGWLWLGEIPPSLSLIGGAIVLMGVWLVNRASDVN